jgi:hypothetical protein
MGYITLAYAGTTTGNVAAAAAAVASVGGMLALDHGEEGQGAPDTAHVGEEGAAAKGTAKACLLLAPMLTGVVA